MTAFGISAIRISGLELLYQPGETMVQGYLERVSRGVRLAGGVVYSRTVVHKPL
jgi:hypothetical protein